MRKEKIIYEGIPYFHPGSLLKEVLKSRYIEQKDLSQRTSISEKHLSLLLSCKVSLSIEVAQKISLVLDENPETWVNMQTKYDMIQEKLKCAEELSRHVDILKKYPIKDMEKYGLIKHCKEKWKTLFQLISFLGFGDTKNIQNLRMVTYRKLNTHDTEEATTILINWGRNIALSKVMNTEYTKKSCEIVIEKIRKSMMKNPLNDNLLNSLQTELSKAGIIFIFTPKIKNTSVSGLSYKLNQHPVIHLTDRNKQVDSFWFSLFHELKHVLDNDILELNKSPEIEEKANNYARDIIIPFEEWKYFLNMSNFSDQKIKEFAEKWEIPIACIVGRLQKEGVLTYQNKNAHQLKEKYLIQNFDNIKFIN